MTSPPTFLRLPIEGELPGFDGALDWLNSAPLTAEGLRGKVVLVDFWTYSCINWIRSLPYIRAWSEKYEDQGLVVVGVHTPEFEFETNVDNVRRAAHDMRVDYPIAIDSDYAIWSVFDNNYWPALYLVDAEGRIRHHGFGEGEYEQSELIIQQLLGTTGAPDVDPQLVSLEPEGVEAPADWATLESRETYVGYARREGFASPGETWDERHAYAIPNELPLGHWALSGEWTMGRQATVVHEPGGRIACRFHARDVHLVMGPTSPGTSARYRVMIDGRAPGTAHGLDTDEQGNGTVTDHRLHQLIRQPTPIEDHLFEIEFPDAGVEAFVFTFG